MTRIITSICLVSTACGAQLASPREQGPATVQAYEESVGAAGRIAVFHAHDGAVAATIVTGGDGTASYPVAAGDLVTVANVGSSVFDLTTFADVTPGDTLVIGEREPEDDHVDLGAVPVALPASLTGAVGYAADLGVSPTDLDGSVTTLNLTDHELDASGAFQVLAVARDTTGAPLAFAVASARADQLAQPIALPAWRTDWDHIAFAIDGLAAGAEVSARAELVQGTSGRFRAEPVSPSDGSRFAIAVPPSLGDQMQYDLAIDEGASSRRVIERGPRTSSIAIDTTRALLPKITAVALSPTDDPARPLVTWAVDGDATAADFAIVRLRWGEGAHRWTILLAPGHEPALQLPALPATLAGWAPDGDLEVAVGLVEMSSLADYRAAIARGVEELDDFDGAQRLSISAHGELGL